MPAPNTSTERIDADWPLTVTPASASQVADERDASLGEAATAMNGISQKIGLR